MYVLDTNVISELRRAPSGRADPNVVRWLEGVEPGACYLSAVTIMELEFGVLGMERRDVRQGTALRRWLEEQVLVGFEGRILPIDTRTARRCASLHVPDRRSGADAMIGATAFVHGMSLVTRNTVDFVSMGVTLVDPWVAS